MEAQPLTNSTTTADGSPIPLCLSNFAHTSTPLQNGLLDGISQLISHTLSECVNFAKSQIQPGHWTSQDLAVSKFAFYGSESKSTEIPFTLRQLNFPYAYCRKAAVYLAPALESFDFKEFAEEEPYLQDWQKQLGVLAMISLHYVSKERMNPDELMGRDLDDVPAVILFQATVEYKTIPPSGNPNVALEELHMRIFGGSRDDGIKYGALAGLDDPVASHALDIYSVRGKRYRFDLMSLPDAIDNDVKALCVVATDHRNDEMEEDENEIHPIVKMEFTIGGKPRDYKSKTNSDWVNHLPPFHFIPIGIADAFLRLNSNPPEMVKAMPSGHTLILDPQYAGRIYIQGQYCTTWGEDITVGSHGEALFGIDLQKIPRSAFGKIEDFETIKTKYAELWHEILIDARLADHNLARRLLFRLMRGTDPPDIGDDDDLYDDFLEDDDETPTTTLNECLESIILSAPTYDRVGIAPKALATRFAEEFGREAFPCQAHEVEWVRQKLPDRDPIVVPLRLISILRRGGYFDVQKTADLLWFTESRAVANGTEMAIAELAVQHLEAAGCSDVDTDNIVVFASPVASNVVTKDAVCRWNAYTEQFFVHQDFFSIPIQEYTDNANQDDPIAIKGFLLGMYIAKVHPNGRILARYILRGGVP